LSRRQQDIEANALSSKSYLTIPIDTLLAGKDAKSVFVFAELLVGGKSVSQNEHFFQPFKSLMLPRPQITMEVAPARSGFRISLSSDKLARAVYLSTSNAGLFTNNYFDLIPGRKVEVEFRARGAVKLADFRQGFKVRSLADAF